MKSPLKVIAVCVAACAIIIPSAIATYGEISAAHIKPQPGSNAGGSRKAAAARCKGRIKIVTAAANFNVRVVNAAADLDVKIVNAAPTGIGEWQIVNAGEDFTVKFVNAGEDFTIRYVNAAPGLH